MGTEELIRFIKWLRDDNIGYMLMNRKMLLNDGNRVASEKDLIKSFKAWDESPLNPINFKQDLVYPENSRKD